MSKDLDVVVWGCTGFTGALAVAYLSGDASQFYSFKLGAPAASAGLRWAVAGRNAEKIAAVRRQSGCPDHVETIIADAGDKAAIEAFVKRAKCVAAFAGPFVRYSDLVVEACAKYGTHYVDICGEPAWVRSCVDRFDDRAKATGACIVNFTGYDSIPSDLGTFYAVNAVRAKAGTFKTRLGVRRVVNYQLPLGGISGGSLQTALARHTHPTVLTAGVDIDSPFVLGGETAHGVRQEDAWQTEAVFVPALGAWTGPFGMETINAPATRRSSAALGYGRDFNYQEVAIAPTEKAAVKMSRQAKAPAPPDVLERLIESGRLPKPGEGPSPKVRAHAKFLSLISAEADDGTTAWIEVSGGEAGYEETAKMCIEAALALVLQPTDCPGYGLGGFQSTASCMGSALVARLERAGIVFREIGDPAARLRAAMQTPTAAKL